MERLSLENLIDFISGLTKVNSSIKKKEYQLFTDIDDNGYIKLSKGKKLSVNKKYNLLKKGDVIIQLEKWSQPW